MGEDVGGEVGLEAGFGAGGAGVGSEVAGVGGVFVEEGDGQQPRSAMATASI